MFLAMFIFMYCRNLIYFNLTLRSLYSVLSLSSHAFIILQSLCIDMYFIHCARSCSSYIHSVYFSLCKVRLLEYEFIFVYFECTTALLSNHFILVHFMSFSNYSANHVLPRST